MSSQLLTTVSNVGTGIVEFLIHWWLQSTLLIAVGLLIGALLKNCGAALQSVVYRVTFVAALLCPFATAILTIGGASGWSLRLSVEQPKQEVTSLAAALTEQSNTRMPN